MWTGWARTWVPERWRSSAGARHGAEYLVESLRDREPEFFADDLEHGRAVTSAALVLFEALTVQRRRTVLPRTDDARVLADALVHFIGTHEGSTERANRERYDALVDASASDERHTIDVDTTVVTDAPHIIRIWRRVLADCVGTVPGVCMTGVWRVQLPLALYETWLNEAARDAADVASVIHLCDVEYSVADDDDDDDDDAMHERAAHQALRPVADAVGRMRGSYGECVRLDWTLIVQDDGTRVRCSVAYKVYAVNEQP